MGNRSLWLSILCFVSLLMSAGCGSGGSGGGGTPPPPKQDFSLKVNPASLSVPAGSLASAVSVSYSGINGFDEIVSISTSLPKGITCGSSVCSGSLSTPSSSLSFLFAASNGVAAGSYNVTFTATFGSLTHTISVPITVTAAPPPPTTAPNQSAFFFSADGSPPFRGVTYDAKHDRIFLSNNQLNEIEVLDANTFKLQQLIPIPSPAWIDLTADNSTLYVGTVTQNLYAVDTTSLKISKRIPLPYPIGSPQITEDDFYPEQVLALSDGTVMILDTCGYTNSCTTATTLVIYSPSTNAFTVPTGTVALSVVGGIYPSADKEHVFIVPSSGTASARYDVSTKTFTPGQVQSEYAVGPAAIKADGSGLAVISGPQILFMDADFNLLGSFSDGQSFGGGILYSPDNSQIFAPEGPGPSYPVDVVDAKTFQLLGQIPNIQLNNVMPPFTYQAWDGEQRMLGLTPNALVALDASMAPTTLTQDQPSFETGETNNSILSPNNDSSGNSTTLDGFGFSSSPFVTFDGQPATNVEVTSPTTVSLTSPTLPRATQADVAAYLSAYDYVLAPSSYSYKPTVLYSDGDGAPATGGSTLTLYGFGYDFPSGSVTVSIGGNSASNVQTNYAGGEPYPVPLYSVTATVPSGSKGDADIEVTTPAGSTTVAGGLAYADRVDYALPSSASPFQMVLDKPRNRLLWTDTALNQVLVYSIASNAIEQTISLNGQPGGLTLTPDGSKLLVTIFDANTLNVYDAASLSLLRSAPTPYPAGGYPILVIGLGGNKAFLMGTASCECGLPVYEYDIAANTFTARTDVAATEISTEAASADGLTAFVAGGIWTAGTDKFVPADDGSDYTSRALNSDGAVIDEFLGIFAQDGTLQNAISLPYQIEEDFLVNTIPGQKLNSTGSLAYLTEVDRIRVADVRHGILLRTIMIPDGLSNEAYDGLAIDPDGQIIYVLTNTGVTSFSFASDPLSVGEIQVNGSQMSVLGSGFASGIVLKVDGKSVNATVQDSQHITASLPSLSSAAHNVTVSLPNGKSYSLDNALDPLPQANSETLHRQNSGGVGSHNATVFPVKKPNPKTVAPLRTRHRPSDWIPARAQRPAGSSR